MDASITPLSSWHPEDFLPVHQTTSPATDAALRAILAKLDEAATLYGYAPPGGAVGKAQVLDARAMLATLLDERTA